MALGTGEMSPVRDNFSPKQDGGQGSFGICIELELRLTTNIGAQQIHHTAIREGA